MCILWLPATIPPLVSDITGLDNYNLTGQSKFNKSTGDLINSFLSLLPAPVCLVAHNGNAYDFPLLKAELEKAGTQLKSDMLCIDQETQVREKDKKAGNSRKKQRGTNKGSITLGGLKRVKKALKRKAKSKIRKKLGK